jgi:DNA-directed RNA polymerase subunit RPC12/RpoP
MEKCELCNAECKGMSGLAMHLSKAHKDFFHEDYYLNYLGGVKKTCPVCGKDVRFINIIKGYVSYCSTTCRNKDPETVERNKKTNLEKYGVENVFQLKDIQEKSKKTHLEKYGVEHNSYIPETIEKRRQTSLKHYGSTCAMASPEVKKKIKALYIEKYGTEFPTQCKEVQDKTKKTNLERYGCENVFQSEEIKDKSKITKLEKYGDSTYSNRDKAVKTQYKIMYNKMINSDRLKSKVIPLFTESEYVNNSHEKYTKFIWKCLKCEKPFEDHMANGRIPTCTHCFPRERISSIKEKELYEFCKSFEENVIANDRSVLNGREIDIYFPDHKLGIEFNGLYWHSELNGKDKYYHIDKTSDAEESGIKLIHIFEDEWNNKQDIVKSMITTRLGKTTNKVHARKCSIKECNSTDAESFFDKNHLQGHINASLNIGLYFNDELISLISVGKPRFNKQYDYEILRFCNKLNFIINGAFSKLYNYFIETYNPLSVITYSDRRFGKGNVYLNSGFEYVSTSKPSYFYMQNYTDRISRMQFQKHKISLLEGFDSNLTEWQNMQLNGYDRIWDCGHSIYKWVA